jgi:hypothetical protein
MERQMVSAEFGTSTKMAVAAMARAPTRSCRAQAGSLAREPIY